MKIKLSELKPNPFRKMEHYPLDLERMAELKQSIKETGFWDNLVIRKNGTHYQIAYGHHRKEAAIEVLGEDYEANLPCRSLSDEHMLKMMITENETIHSHRAEVLKENVRAVKEWFEQTPDGKAEYKDLSSRKLKGPNRKERVYAEFMGIPLTRVRTALALIEADNPELERAAPSIKHAQVILQTVKDKEVATELAKVSREEELGKRDTEQVGRAIRSVARMKGNPKQKKTRQRKILKAVKSRDPKNSAGSVAEQVADRILHPPRKRTPEEQIQDRLENAEEMVSRYASNLSGMAVAMGDLIELWQHIDPVVQNHFTKNATVFLGKCRDLERKIGGKKWLTA